MFRCSLARVCPRRRISPPWTGTPRTCQASPSSFLSSSSPARKSEHSMASHTPQDAHKDTRLRDVRLSKLFLAPSARGIAAGSASKGMVNVYIPTSFHPLTHLNPEDPHALLVRAGYIRQVRYKSNVLDAFRLNWPIRPMLAFSTCCRWLCGCSEG